MAQRNRAWLYSLLPVLRGVGLLLHVPAVMAFISVPICLFFGEYRGLIVFGATAAVSLVCGQILYWPARSEAAVLSRHAMLIAAITWLVVSIVAAVPFILGADTPVLDAIFEALSGFTGAGMTLLEPSGLPHYLQWWRSLTQWIGGVGVIVLLLSILPPQRGALELYYSESREQKLLPSVRSTVRMIWSIYGSYTLLAIALLWMGGVPIWRAVNHAMTAIATGGFTITDDSLAHVPTVEKVLYIPIMIAGTISFHVHYRVMHERRPRAWFGNSEHRLLWCMLILGAAVLAVVNMGLAQASWIDSVFQWVSALSTTGMQTVPLAQWHPSGLVFLTMAMFVGGAAGSTSGGLKIVRLVTIYKSIAWSVKDATRRPHEIIRLTFDGNALTKADAEARVRGATTLVYGWFLVAAIAVLAMTFCVPDDTPLQYTVFDVISAQSDVGLNTGVVGPQMSAGGKLVLMTVMWMGRLEIIPVLVLLAVLVRGGLHRRN